MESGELFSGEKVAISSRGPAKILRDSKLGWLKSHF